MKFKIVFDNNKDTLRVRAGKYAFTEKEGYGIAQLLSENKNIKKVKVSYTNGSIYVKYSKNKNQVLKAIQTIKKEDLFEADPTEYEIDANINRKYINKIIYKIAKRYFSMLILPVPIGKIIIIKNSIPYMYNGIKSLLNFRLDVDLLDATAITMTLLKGTIQSAGSITFLLGLTDILEEYTIEKTKHSLENSLMININKVWIKTDTGEEIEIPFSDIRKDDKVIVRTGTIIPVDGTIIEGDAEINEATMTGESQAVNKSVGKRVFAGTIVENGTIVVKTDAVNEETRINQIFELIENSEQHKAEIQSKAESLADSIVPLNFGLTGLTYLLTNNTEKALAALTVDYSCAIKLATPLTIISTMREASEREIVIKGGKFLEAYATADTIVFDKTGTLTKACPHVAKVVPFGNLTEIELLKQAACLEEHFPHSVANAIVNKAKEEGLDHTDELHSEVEYIVAHGISSKLLGKKVVIGSRHFVIEDENVEITEKDNKIIEENKDQYSIIYFAINGKLEGIICIDDPPRTEAKHVLDELKKLGIKNIIMLTGDSENAAKTTAQTLGITQYKSEVLPEDKSRIINKLKQEGKKVIMVGDGINDSPALSAADVSVAMKDSSDLAREVADITLLRHSLDDLITLRLLSEKMLETIDKNYFDIVTINTSLIALGTAGIITPSVTSFLHNLSTMLIGLRSTRSKNFKKIPQIV